MAASISELSRPPPPNKCEVVSRLGHQGAKKHLARQYSIKSHFLHQFVHPKAILCAVSCMGGVSLYNSLKCTHFLHKLPFPFTACLKLLQGPWTELLSLQSYRLSLCLTIHDQPPLEFVDKHILGWFFFLQRSYLFLIEKFIFIQYILIVIPFVHFLPGPPTSPPNSILSFSLEKKTNKKRKQTVT